MSASNTSGPSADPTKVGRLRPSLAWSTILAQVRRTLVEISAGSRPDFVGKIRTALGNAGRICCMISAEVCPIPATSGTDSARSRRLPAHHGVAGATEDGTSDIDAGSCAVPRAPSTYDVRCLQRGTNASARESHNSGRWQCESWAEGWWCARASTGDEAA